MTAATSSADEAVDALDFDPDDLDLLTMGPTWERDAFGRFVEPERTLGWAVLEWCSEWLLHPYGFPVACPRTEQGPVSVLVGLPRFHAGCDPRLPVTKWCSCSRNQRASWGRNPLPGWSISVCLNLGWVPVLFRLGGSKGQVPSQFGVRTHPSCAPLPGSLGFSPKGLAL